MKDRFSAFADADGLLKKCSDQLTGMSASRNLTCVQSRQYSNAVLFQWPYSQLTGTVSYEGKHFEVPYELSSQTVQLVVDPHTETVVGVEDWASESLSLATLLDNLLT